MPSKKLKFYRVAMGRGERGSGFVLLNDMEVFRELPHIFVPSPGQRGFRKYNATPIFLADPKQGMIHRDMEMDADYLFISERMKAVIERIDRAAFAFVQCKVQMRDGSEGPVRWLCDVTRVLDALDEENSDVIIGIADNGSKVYNLRPGGGMTFKPSVIGSQHIFRMAYFQAAIVCDDDFRLACKSAKLTGVRFIDWNRRPHESPRGSHYWANGNSNRERGDLAMAIASYGEAIRLGRGDTFYPRYFFARAEARFADKDLDGAIADYDEAIKESKKAVQVSWLAEAYWRRGNALLQKGDRTRAEEDFEAARKLRYDRVQRLSAD